MRNGSARRVAVSGLLTSLMLVLGLIERQFPLTAAIPGIKLGLANSVLIYALYMLGVKQSIVLMLLKAMMSWLIYTNMQAMFYSLAGGVLSLLAMIALSRIKGVSVIGVSALGAGRLQHRPDSHGGGDAPYAAADRDLPAGADGFRRGDGCADRRGGADGDEAPESHREKSVKKIPGLAGDFCMER